MKILFSDKTGTLTKNEMILQQCSINGRKFLLHEGGVQEEGKPHLIRLSNYREDIIRFFQSLSVCHTVQVAGAEKASAKEQQEDAEMEASFEIVDDDDLSTGSSSSSDSWNDTSVPGGSSPSDNNADQNVTVIGNRVLYINDLNNPGSEAGCSSGIMSEQHKRTNTGAPRISFNIDNKIYPVYSRSVSMETPKPPTLPRPKSLAVIPMQRTPTFGRKHMPKIASPLTIDHPSNFDELDRSTNRPQENPPYRLTHRRTQSASVATSKQPPVTNGNVLFLFIIYMKCN